MLHFTRDNGFAEKVFQSITPQDTAAYNTLLQGMIRYNQIDKGWKLYEEIIEKELPLTVECLNSLLRASAYLRDSDELRWKLVEVSSALLKIFYGSLFINLCEVEITVKIDSEVHFYKLL